MAYIMGSSMRTGLIIWFTLTGFLALSSTRLAGAEDHSPNPANTQQSASFGGGLLTGILGSSVVAAIVTQVVGRFKDRDGARQKIMEFLIERRQALSKDPDLLQTISFWSVR